MVTCHAERTADYWHASQSGFSMEQASAGGGCADHREWDSRQPAVGPPQRRLLHVRGGCRAQAACVQRVDEMFVHDREVAAHIGLDEQVAVGRFDGL